MRVSKGSAEFGKDVLKQLKLGSLLSENRIYCRSLLLTVLVCRAGPF